MRRIALWFALVACAHAPRTPEAPPCPVGFDSDPARSERLRSLLANAGEESPLFSRTLCFGPSPSLGVLAAGRPLLDKNAQDKALAARLVHLGIHVRDNLGDGCDAGLDNAIASEVQAHKREAAVRARFGLAPEVEDPADPVADYKARCSR
jgi:hypothetical protein